MWSLVFEMKINARPGWDLSRVICRARKNQSSQLNYLASLVQLIPRKYSNRAIAFFSESLESWRSHIPVQWVMPYSWALLALHWTELHDSGQGFYCRLIQAHDWTLTVTRTCTINFKSCHVVKVSMCWLYPLHATGICRLLTRASQFRAGIGGSNQISWKEAWDPLQLCCRCFQATRIMRQTLQQSHQPQHPQ